MENKEIFDLETIIRRVGIKYPCFGTIIANTKFQEIVGGPSTDGKIIYYDPAWFLKLTPDERTGVFAHEIFHIAYNHILRSENKNARIWNLATDAVINQIIIKNGLSLPSFGVHIPEAINYDAETLYQKMLIEYEKKDRTFLPSIFGGYNIDGESDDFGHDSHKLWREAVKKHNENPNSTQNPQIIDSEHSTFEKNKQMRKKNIDKLLDSLSKDSTKAGESALQSKKVESIGYGRPLIDWRLWLKEAINSKADWSYTNAEIENGIVRPVLEVLPFPETEILLDTSGSISKTLLTNFLRECKNILQASKVKVGCFNTEFYGFEEISSMEDIDKLKYPIGGNTDFDVAVNAFTKRVENKIIFTDGQAKMPDSSVDAIWVVFGEKRIKPLGGRVIYISNDQLEKLNYEYPEDSKVDVRKK